ncbi:MFS transporter [Yinghuangia sp. ASG 101]|uniref:MFS transporter n=1 Tax=Yinghuangia sp. ASG 101 TaxID=2896848 RepID=UPI001E33CDCB|nr:MFS transporter [Yinghuangia sp. ASG 101]UGQ10156.1 MFS transporter [Yinghuangia sp. ASG 101]
MSASASTPAASATPPVGGAAAPPPPDEAGPPRPGLALAVVVGAMLLVGIDVTVVNLALPDMRAALDMSSTASAWILNAYTLSYGGLLLLGGRVGDALGRRRVFCAGVGLFTAASLLAGLAPWAWWLIAARVLQGVGGALIGPSTMALLVSMFAGAARARAISWYSAVLGGGATVGLILGGLLTELASWRWVFLINVPLGAALVVLAPRIVPRVDRAASGTRPAFDFAGTITVTGGVGALVYACIRAGSHGWGDGATVAALIVAAVLLAVFVPTQRHAAEPLTRTATRGTLARILPPVALLGAAMFGVLFFLGQYFQEARGYTPVRAGLAFLPMMAAQFAMARLAPTLVRRVGPAWPAVTGASAVTVGLLWLWRIGETDAYAAGILGPLVLVGAGAGAAMSPMSIFGLSGVAPAESGAASGLLQTTQWLAGTVGLAVWVTVFGHATRDAAPGASPEHVLTHGVGASFGAAAISAAAAVLAASTLFRARRDAA